MSEAKNNLKVLLRELHEVMGVTGNEQEVIRLVHQKISPYADEVRISNIGNMVAVKKGSRPGPSVVVSAHVDEIGFVVRNILPNGFLLIDKIGGVPDNIMLGRKVLVSTKRIPGIIGTKPGHLQSPEEARTVQSIAKCYVDLGFDNGDDVRAQGIKVGDPVIFKSDFMEMANPDLVATRAVDDRISCAIIIELFKNLAAEDFAGTLYGVFTVREEAGLFGAANAVSGLDVDYVLALDTVPAGDTPDINTVSQLPIYLGKGPGLVVADNVGATFFQFIHPGVRKQIEQTAAKENINLQECTILGYAYTTDAASFSYANGGGIPTAGISIPRRYSHSPVELVNMNDAADTYRLVKAIVEENETIDLSFVTLD